ncbi:MAG: alanine:cation symporter family protein [Oscillospiraceae bacterium]|nr:alanine:cation symporter family protein [Oscillospiraceae bacterium]
MTFGSIIGSISGFMYSYLLVALLILGGLWFTISTRCVQFRMLGESIKVVMEKPEKEGAVSSFQALMVSTASRVGTGNIVGVATAICLGGYGAVFWMWVIAIIGGGSAFIESTLAQIYKRRHPDGTSYGGPAYYIQDGLKSRGLGMIFAISMILTYAGGFNMLASYNLQSTFSGYGFYNPETTPWVIGAVLAIIVFYCLVGGGQRIVKVTSTLVPFMGALYIGVALVVTVLNIKLLPGVLANVFADAFNFGAIFGGFTGSCMMYGIKRGLFSNEAGVGSAPNAAAAADVSHPVKQGLVQMLSVFIDTLLICTSTALMTLCSGVAPSADLAGAPYVQAALQNVMGAAGPIFITVAMILFAFTTLLGNFYYVDNLLIFVMGKVPSKQFMLGFRVVAALVIFVGAGLSMGVVWDLADVLMGIMAIINIPVIIILGKAAIKALDDYIAQKKEGKNPTFKASTVGLEGKVDYWN